MRILSYSQEGDYVRVVTDNPGRPEFVYSAYSFPSIASLSLEIERSIARESSRKSDRQSKLSFLSSELKSSGAVEAVASEEVSNAPN